MAKFNDDENNDLNESVDFDFFDDKRSEESDSNNNAVIKSSNNEIKNKVVNNEEEKSKSEILKKSLSSKTSDQILNDTSDESSDASSRSLYSKSSKICSDESDNDIKRQSSKLTNTRRSSESSMSTKPSSSHIRDSSSLRKSSDESDVTSVSSLESEDLSEIVEIKPEKRTQKPVKSSPAPPPPNSKFHSHLRSSDDRDMISTDVILQAMMRIHEERRIVQNLKPKWVDPNTKDYSVSGITAKLNLVPDRLVSMPPKKFMRLNPFYCNDADIERRLYHTAINRNKERDRIDKENKDIIARLQRIRPSPGITKAELLKEYTRINRFSNPIQPKFRVSSTAQSCRPQSSSNSGTGLNLRRAHSSTIISRYADSRQSNSRKSDNKRIMSANSLTSHSTRRSNNTNSGNKRN